MPGLFVLKRLLLLGKTAKERIPSLLVRSDDLLPTVFRLQSEAIHFVYTSFLTCCRLPDCNL
jgi:hypothetical protein